MDNYVARANIDHYLELLDRDDIPSEKRTVITKLLIEEENRLSHDLEQLEFAESRVAACRGRLGRLQHLRHNLDDSADRQRADDLLQTFQTTLERLESFCRQMRKRVEANRL
jgi:hypothetical protein